MTECGRGDLWRIGAAALVLRAVVFGVISWARHLSPWEYANLYDGHSYLYIARVMLGEGLPFSDYHARVFPGFPAVVALLHRAGVPMAAGALGVNWISAALAAMLAAALFGDRRVGWAMVCLIPHYLMNSTMAMSEAAMLALGLGGLVLMRRGHASGGMLVGLAGLVRPMAVFVGLGGAAMLVKERRWKDLIVSGGAAVLTGVIGLAMLHFWRGDALAGYRYQAASPASHGGELVSWPFRSLIQTPGIVHASVGRVAYIWGHAVVTVGACGVIGWRLWRTKGVDWRDWLAGPWLWGNTVFVLCIGSVWGFECFHRFTVPALPAMFWAGKDWLPRGWKGWGVIGVVSAGVAAFSA